MQHMFLTLPPGCQAESGPASRRRALDTRMKLLFHVCNMPQPLLLLLVGVPPHPSSLRVRVWRRLRSLGAVPLKRSAYLLPDTPDRYEDFQWLAQEIQREGGEATLIR